MNTDTKDGGAWYPSVEDVLARFDKNTLYDSGAPLHSLTERTIRATTDVIRERGGQVGGEVRQSKIPDAWSFLRNVLTQGMAIQMDYHGGKYANYELLSARLDEAAREREVTLRELIARPITKKE